ncbi:MAG: SPW repeat domain-containing protein [Bacteroidia bacterium]
MKIINTKLHGIIDYAIAFSLLIPWIVDFHVTSEDTWILAVAGTAIGLYSFLTDYEFGMIKAIPMKVHLALDVVISIFLVAMPFIFNLSHYSKWPIVLGIIGILVILLSNASAYKVTHQDLNITKP